MGDGNGLERAIKAARERNRNGYSRSRSGSQERGRAAGYILNGNGRGRRNGDGAERIQPRRNGSRGFHEPVVSNAEALERSGTGLEGVQVNVVHFPFLAGLQLVAGTVQGGADQVGMRSGDGMSGTASIHILAVVGGDGYNLFHGAILLSIFRVQDRNGDRVQVRNGYSLPNLERRGTGTGADNPDGTGTDRNADMQRAAVGAVAVWDPVRAEGLLNVFFRAGAGNNGTDPGGSG